MHQHTTLGLNDAERAINAIKHALQSRQKAAVIAVTDDHGELIALARLDGAPLQSVTIASNKAFSAAREGKPTLEIGRGVRDAQNGFDIAYFGDKRFIGWGGGIPVIVAGRVVGAVAVSGVPELEDVELAEIGVQAILQGQG